GSGRTPDRLQRLSWLPYNRPREVSGMTLTLELTPETDRRVRRLAAGNGQSIQEDFVHLVSRVPEVPLTVGHEATAALFRQWAEDDSPLTPEEAAREDQDWRQVEANLQASRLTLPVPEM